MEERSISSKVRRTRSGGGGWIRQVGEGMGEGNFGRAVNEPVAGDRASLRSNLDEQTRFESFREICDFNAIKHCAQLGVFKAIPQSAPHLGPQSHQSFVICVGKV